VKIPRNLGLVTGSAASTAVFALLNYRSYLVNRAEFESRKFHFFPDGFSWGFPIGTADFAGCSFCDLNASFLAFSIDLFCWLAVSALVGIVCEMVAERIPEHEELNQK
jgi:hypothetical protein